MRWLTRNHEKYYAVDKMWEAELHVPHPLLEKKMVSEIFFLNKKLNKSTFLCDKLYLLHYSLASKKFQRKLLCPRIIPKNVFYIE